MANVELRTFQVQNFDSISFRALGSVTIYQGEEEGLTVQGEPSALEHIKVDVENRQLQIRLYTWYDFLFLPRPAKYEIRLKNLHRLDVSGSADVEMAELISSELKLSTSGSGNVHIGSLEVSHFQINVSGSSHLRIDELVSENVVINASGSGHFVLKGRADRLEIRTSGSAEVDALQLDANHVKISVSGSGKFVVTAMDTLDVSVSGNGRVGYRGDPRISQAISGSGTVYRVDQSA